MSDKRATREAYGKALVELGKEYPDLVVMDADLSGSTKTGDFAKAYPERFFNVGIAEQNLYGMAAGLALSGKRVCASTFAMFAAGRAFEIIRNSIAYTEANVNICATHAGITVGEDGASHQTFEDIALMRTIPGMTVVCPSDGYSTEKLLRQVVDMDAPSYVRLGRAPISEYYGDGDEIILGKANILREGRDATIIATGIMVEEAMKAALIMSQDGVDVGVCDMHTIKPLDEETVIKLAAETGRIVTAEEHSIIGGLGSAVAEVIARECPAKMAMVGQQDVFGESGTPDELKSKYGMDASAIVQAVKQIY